MKIDLRPLVALLLPSRCAGCGRRGVELCERCLAAIRGLDRASCPRCGRHSKLGRLCPSCEQYDGPLSGIRTACVYEGVARKAIHGFKYRQRSALAGPLAGLLAAELLQRPLKLDYLVPVPLHPRRLAERGFNQSGLLARHLGTGLEVPVLDCLERNRETRTQADLKAQARRQNVRGAFSARHGTRLDGARVGVVDDVCTTGATLEDCARALREARASAVWGIAVARDL